MVDTSVRAVEPLAGGGSAKICTEDTGPSRNRTVSLNSTPVREIEEWYEGPTGPATKAFARDLTALEQAVATQDPTANAKIQSMFKQHKVVDFLRALGRGWLLPGTTYGKPEADPTRAITYGVDGIRPCKYDPYKIQNRLAELAPRVAAGEMSIDEARKKAARPVLSSLTGIFNDVPGMELANLDEQRGVLINFGWDYDHVCITTLGEMDPNYYDISKYSWQDLDSSMVLDKSSFEVIGVDRFTPEKSYASVLRLLRYVGDVARFWASKKSPTLPIDGSGG